MTDAAPANGPEPHDDETLFPKTAGERLRAAREAQGLSIGDIAARTRVPIRHLEAIESGDYSDMPTPTYAIGFAKAYARAVGEDEVAIGRDVRGKTASISRERQQYQPYEMDEPMRVPPRGLAVVAGVVAVLVLIGAAIWFGTSWFQGNGDTGTATQPASEQAMPVPPAPVALPAATSAGKVTLTALDRVWVRVYDATGKTLFENTMNTGDTYDVPTDVDHPLISVGRPDKLQVTLDGQTMPPLGAGAKPVKDLAIDAAAVKARADAAAAAPTPTAKPTTATAPAATPTHAAAAPAPKPAARKPAAKKTPAPAPSKKPLDLDLKTTPPPVPTNNGIY